MLRKAKLPTIAVTSFALWGLAVISLHATASVVHVVTPTHVRAACDSSLQPWFVHRYSCAVLNVNCHHRNILGTAQEIDHLLGNYHAPSIRDLVIMHCPQLHMPQRLATLSNLFSIDIYNSTIIEWNESAALRQRTTPDLRTIVLVLANMSTLPIGILANDPPLGLHTFELAGTNITALPTDLHTKWPNMLSFYVERAQLHEFPDTLAKMHITRLSLMNNHIEKIPDDLLRDNAFEILSLVGNPLQAWPATIGNVAGLTTLLMDYTPVGALPAWAVDEGRRRAQLGQTLVISAGGSTYCLSSSSNRTENGPMEAGLLIECREKLEEELEGAEFTFIQANYAI